MDKITELEKLIFTEDKGKIYLGGEEIQPQILQVLKEEAKYIVKSQLFEVINATVTNESFNLGIGQSKDWNNVEYAKALYYWGKVFNKIINKFSKLDNK